MLHVHLDGMSEGLSSDVQKPMMRYKWEASVQALIFRTTGRSLRLLVLPFVTTAATTWESTRCKNCVLQNPLRLVRHLMLLRTAQASKTLMCSPGRFQGYPWRIFHAQRLVGMPALGQPFFR